MDNNLQVGNAVINDMTDAVGMYDFLATHALIADETAQDMRKYCDFSPNAPNSELSSKCAAASNEAELDINHIDIYNIYAPLCHDSNLTSKPSKASVSSITIYTLDPHHLYTYIYIYPKNRIRN